MYVCKKLKKSEKVTLASRNTLIFMKFWFRVINLMSRFYVCSYRKKCCFQILEIIFWKQNDFYKQGFLKNFYNKNQRKKTTYFDELRITYIHTDRQTDIHNFYNPLDNDRNTVERPSFSNFYSPLNSLWGEKSILRLAQRWNHDEGEFGVYCNFCS